jgi:hypothetical protein
MGNWYRGHISQSWNQVFSPADHKIYSFKTEPHQTIHVYEQQYTRCSCQWQYQRSSPVLTFPIDIAPISGKFKQGFFIPNNLDGTTDVVDPPPNNKPTWERQMLHGYQCFLPLQDIADSIW